MENNLDAPLATVIIVVILVACAAFFLGAWAQDILARRKQKNTTFITNVYSTAADTELPLDHITAAAQQAEADFYNGEPRETVVYDQLATQYDKENYR